MRGEPVVGGDHVPQAVLSRHGVVKAAGLGVAAQVEGERDAAERGDGARRCEVLLLAAAPAVNAEHAGRACFDIQRRRERPSMRSPSTRIETASRTRMALHQRVFHERTGLRVHASSTATSGPLAPLGTKYKAEARSLRRSERSLQSPSGSVAC